MSNRRTSLSLFILGAAMLLASSTLALPQVICGNVDADTANVVDIGDLTYLINFLFNQGPAPYSMWSANVESDGCVDISDLTYLGNYLFLEGPAPDCIDSVTDIDGNTYAVVSIGSQLWMAENLGVVRYQNEDSIPNITDNGDWADLDSGAYCNYSNNVANAATYGRLYNWFAATDERNIAPQGWRVPSDDDWKTLEIFLGMSQAEADTTGLRGTDEGGLLKDTVLWNSPNTGASNESGFSALPAGERGAISSQFEDLGNIAVFWTASDSTEVLGWNRMMTKDTAAVGRSNIRKRHGFSIRCIWNCEGE